MGYDLSPPPMKAEVLQIFVIAVFAGRHTKVLTHIGAEMAHVGETHTSRDFLDAKMGAAEEEPDFLNGVLCHPFGSSLATILQTEHGEVFRSNGKVAGIDSDGLSFDLTVGDKTEETIEKHFPLRWFLLMVNAIGALKHTTQLKKQGSEQSQQDVIRSRRIGSMQLGIDEGEVGLEFLPANGCHSEDIKLIDVDGMLPYVNTVAQQTTHEMISNADDTTFKVRRVLSSADLYVRWTDECLALSDLNVLVIGCKPLSPLAADSDERSHGLQWIKRRDVANIL